jgi:hypothetical protein
MPFWAHASIGNAMKYMAIAKARHDLFAKKHGN